MKYAAVGRENRKVYRVEEPNVREVYRMEVSEVPDGEEPTPPELVIDKELVIPSTSSHREIIEISDEDADRIAATDGTPASCCWKIIGGTLQNAELPY